MKVIKNDWGDKDINRIETRFKGVIEIREYCASFDNIICLDKQGNTIAEVRIRKQ